MAENELKVIVKAKELAVHSFKLPPEKFQASYGAWKNHVSHGNCRGLLKTVETEIKSMVKEQEDDVPL